jgi:SNF2 family DNA or RNA helicase
MLGKSSEGKNSTTKTDKYTISLVKIKFNILITSYELLIKDIKILKNIEWETIVVDEVHYLLFRHID